MWLKYNLTVSNITENCDCKFYISPLYNSTIETQTYPVPHGLSFAIICAFRRYNSNLLFTCAQTEYKLIQIDKTGTTLCTVRSPMWGLYIWLVLFERRQKKGLPVPLPERAPNKRLAFELYGQSDECRAIYGALNGWN